MSSRTRVLLPGLGLVAVLVSALLYWNNIHSGANTSTGSESHSTGDPTHPNLLIILIDTLRADHLGCYGHTPSITPNIDHLAAQGIRYENAYAQASWTKTSVASLFTGVYPDRHRVFEERGSAGVLPEAAQTLAEVLRAGGYKTAATSGNPHITPAFGFGQGFIKFQYNKVWVPFTLNLSLEAAEDLLTKRKSTDPFFLYVHLLDPHDPYARLPRCDRLLAGLDVDDPDVLSGNGYALTGEQALGATRLLAGELPTPRPLDPDEMRYLTGLYDCEVSYADNVVGALMRLLQKLGELDNTVVVVTADHGEEFRDHGLLRHGYQLYNETVSVPLIIRTPGGQAVNQTVAEPVQLLDLFPTLLFLGGVSDEGLSLDGSLLPPFRHRKAGEVPSAFGMATWRTIDKAYLVRGTTKVIVDRRSDRWECYDLSQDPGETRNLTLANCPEGEATADALRAVLSRNATPLPSSEPKEIDPALREQLRALGYVE